MTIIRRPFSIWEGYKLPHVREKPGRSRVYLVPSLDWDLNNAQKVIYLYLRWDLVLLHRREDHCSNHKSRPCIRGSHLKMWDRDLILLQRQEGHVSSLEIEIREPRIIRSRPCIRRSHLKMWDWDLVLLHRQEGHVSSLEIEILSFCRDESIMYHKVETLHQRVTL